MADNTEPFEAYERTHRLVESLLRGEQPDPWPNLSQQEADMMRVAGALNSVGATPRPRPEFVQGLAQELQHMFEPQPHRLWSRLTRRGLLRGVAGAAGLLVAGAAAQRAATDLGTRNPGAGWVAVAETAELMPGTPIRFLAAGHEGYVLNIDGSLRAMSALCTHLPCVLQWSTGQEEFICPCHQAEFTADGQHRPTPDYDHQLPPLATFPIRQVGSTVYVFPGESVFGTPQDQSNEEDEYRRP
ncbi:MAG TPA: Rieske (2Fe-2S) protein [Chloroflexota bacterium]|nr:Rieske (2Fe-2S) protein [Chloroflexota bacterium]